MKKLFLMLFLAFSAFGADNVHVNFASNPMGATYNTSFPQLTLSGLVAKSHLGVVNGSSGAVCCNTVTASPLTAPTAGNGNERCVPANSNAALDFVQISANVYCRSFSGTLSTGTLDVWTW